MTIEAITNMDSMNKELLDKIEEMSPKTDIFSILVEDQIIKEEAIL